MLKNEGAQKRKGNITNKNIKKEPQYIFELWKGAI